jgi:cytoskeletal protein CcmA (bactofilin family)
MSVWSHSRRFAGVGAVLLAGILVIGSGTGAVGAPPTATSPVRPAAAAADLTGPQFYSGTVVDVSGHIDGDVYAAGQTVTISGDVTGDVIAAGQTIAITGTVEGNVRLAGQDVSITGDVGRSGTLFGTNVSVGDTGSIGDDVVAAGTAIGIAGKIGRDLIVGAGSLSIDGSVGGDVTYYGDTTAHITDGAVGGTVQHITPAPRRTVEVSPWVAVLGWFLGLLYALVALSVVAVAAGLLIPLLLGRVTDQLMPSPWKALLVGFVACIAVPVALLCLLITIVGSPLALAGLLIWLVLTLATFVYGAFYIGRLLLRGSEHPALKSLLGGVILITALQIPWLNIFVWLAMVFFGVGAQLLQFYSQRPWAVRADIDAGRATPVAPTQPQVGNQGGST